MLKRTRHGEGVAEQIQEEDCYGNTEVMNMADLWYILDNFHTHLLDNGALQKEMQMIEKWLNKIELQYDIEM